MSTDRNDNVLLLFADRVYPGVGTDVIKDGFVAIKNGRVEAVGPAAKNPYPPATPSRRFPGCTIIPGLIDSHVHLTFSAGEAPLKEIQSDNDLVLMMRGAANARMALEAGVTTIRDLGSRGRTLLDLRDSVAKGIVPGPRILASGRPITCPGGHLHFLGGVAQGVDGVKRLTTELIEEGVDVIKVIATGGNMTHGSDPLRAQFTVEEIRAIVDLANQAGLKVTVHARGVEGIKVSVDAGVHGVEHSRMEVAPGEWGFNEELARDMARRKVAAAPTFAASFRAFQYKSAGLRAGAIPIPIRQKNAARLRECGVRVVAGTDAGASLCRFDEAIHLEMEILVGAGWTPIEALEAATRGSAEAIGREDSVGTLEPGKLADIVVVHGDPTKNISDARQIAHVFQDGREVVDQGEVITDARPYPWPAEEIAQRSLFKHLAKA
ncbi:MAG: amidohydrolase family protein [Pseudorhodoplanes sp.]